MSRLWHRTRGRRREPRRFSARAGRGFTMVELMVSVAILLVLFAIVSQILDPVRRTVAVATANAEIVNYASSIEATLRDEVRRMSADGFLVIKGQATTGLDATTNPPAPRVQNTDQLVFFATGPWTSQQLGSGGLSRTVQADVARIWWGQMYRWRDANANDVIDSNAPPNDEWLDLTGAGNDTDYRWNLGCQVLLLTHQPLPGGVTAADNLWDRTGLWKGLTDIADTDMSAIRMAATVRAEPAPSGYAASPPGSAAPDAWNDAVATDAQITERRLRETCFRIIGQNWVSPSALATRGNAMLNHAVIAPNCATFRVEFAGDFYDAANGATGQDGRIDTAAGGGGPGGGAADPTYWYGLTVDAAGNINTATTGVDAIDDTSVASTYTATFGYDRVATPWPKMLRVTVTLHDRQGKLRDMANKASGLSDGKTFQFIVTLPQ